MKNKPTMNTPAHRQQVNDRLVALEKKIETIVDESLKTLKAMENLVMLNRKIVILARDCSQAQKPMEKRVVALEAEIERVRGLGVTPTKA